jgi:hypothetical protein
VERWFGWTLTLDVRFVFDLARAATQVLPALRYPAQRLAARTANPALSAGVPFQPRCAHAGRTACALAAGAGGASP